MFVYIIGNISRDVVLLIRDRYLVGFHCRKVYLVIALYWWYYNNDNLTMHIIINSCKVNFRLIFREYEFYITYRVSEIG